MAEVEAGPVVVVPASVVLPASVVDSVVEPAVVVSLEDSEAEV